MSARVDFVARLELHQGLSLFRVPRSINCEFREADGCGMQNARHECDLHGSNGWVKTSRV